MIEYRQNSKKFEYSDPTMINNKSIQHAGMYEVYLMVKRNGKWEFPSTHIKNNLGFELTKEMYFKSLADGWSCVFLSNYPSAVNKTNIAEEEIQNNEFLRKCVGRKVFYFKAYHDQGSIKFKEDVEDYAWVSKLELNKFVDEQDFAFYSKVLDSV